MFRRYVLPWLVWIFYRLWTASWRIQIIESEEMKAALQSGEPLVLAHWHGDELCVVHLVTRYKIATMTSTSKDGQLIDFVVHKLGGATSRGSSTRGGVAALKGLVRLVNQGYRGSVAVDGPKGPIYQVKPGIFELSRLTKAKIFPVGAACDRSFIFHKSWNKAKLPKLFSRVVIYFGEPLAAINREESPKSDELAQRLSTGIWNACKTAAEHLPSVGG